MGLSRSEDILESIIDGTPYDKPPLSRIEALLIKIAEEGGGGGGADALNKKVVVDSLPTENISTSTIYIVPSETPEEGNVKDEWINLTGTANGWEKLGSDDDIPVTSEEYDDMTSHLHSL